MKLRLALALAATSAALLAAACSSGSAGPASPGSGSVIPLLRVGSTQVSTNVDLTKTGSNVDVTQLALETLLTFGPQGQLEPYLATSWAQAGPVTYVYHLRHGVRFWDGHQLTAADVAYSLNYERAPTSDLSAIFASVKSITATGPYTVVVTLSHPDASWQDVPATPFAPIFEKAFALAHKGTMGNPGVLIEGTGPWEIDSLDPTRGLQLSANPHWWRGTVPIKRISYTFYSSETSEALAFRAGEVDLDPFILDPRSFAATSGARLLDAASCDGALFSMNTLTAPWSDIHVRRAVAYALNRTAIIAAGGGPASPIDTMIPPQALRTIASAAQVGSMLRALPQYPYDLAKARQEMAESGYPHGFSTTLEEYTGLGQAVNQSQVIAAELHQIGISAHIRVTPLNTWATIVTSGPASKRPASFYAYGCENPDVSGYIAGYLGSSNLQPGEFNTAGYAPAEVNTLLSAGIATSNPASRFAVYSRLLQQLASDVPYIPLYVQDQSIALSSRFTFSGLSFYSLLGPYALNIKPAS
jgi:peptide/nickel transport system substrate-binding protein